MIGKTISHYRIIEKIGSGGMGDIYKAEDTKLKRSLALKFLPPELTRDAEAKKRLINEAQTASALQHNNICTIYEINETEPAPGEPGGQLYISMEFLSGKTLKKRIEEKELTTEEALGIATQLAQGLDKAHKKGIIHRDIKPANVMITEDGVIKIVDFGLAKLAGGTLLTKAGTTLGTVSYMSPEQTQGIDVDHRTDIWALGVILYEMLAGERPFKGDYDQAVMYSILNEAPEPVIKINASIPNSLEQVVGKALEKDRDKRHQSITELLNDLKSISAGIVPDAIKTRARKAKRLERKRAILYTSLTSLLIAAVIILSLFIKRTQTIASIAVLPLKNLTGDISQQYFVDGVTDELIGVLGRISGLKRVISRTSVMQYKESDKPLSDIARELKVDAIVEGTIYEVGDSIRVRLELIDVLSEEKNLWGDTYKRAKGDVMVLYSDVARAISREIRIGLTDKEKTYFAQTRQVNPEAYEAYLKGQFHWNIFTKQDLELARQYFELALEIDPDYAPAYHGIAFYWGAMTYFGVLPRKLMPKWRAAAEKGLDLDSTLAEGHYSMAGLATWYEFDWNKAEREFRFALKLNPNYAQARVFYGLFLTGMGRFEEAKTQMKAGIKLDPMNAMYQGYLGIAFMRARQYDQAIAQFHKSLALQPGFGSSMGGLMHCYHQKGLYEKAFAVRRKIYETKGSLDLLEALDRGYKEGGYKEAMRQVAEALVARSNRAYSLGIALYYTYAEDKERALDWLEIAFEERMQDLVYLNVHPKWDFLRDEPRFREVVRKMNYPQEK